MSRFILALMACLTLVAVGCNGGNEAPSEATPLQLYSCGMHPEVINEGPGTCPICGMDLTPVHRSAAAETSQPAKGLVVIDPIVVQNMGVRLARVKKGPIFRHVRTLGEIEVVDVTIDPGSTSLGSANIIMKPTAMNRAPNAQIPT